MLHFVNLLYAFKCYGHLGCFCILPAVNNVAVNIGVCIPFQITVFIFFGYIPKGVEFLDHDAVSWGTAILFSIVTSPVYIPTSRIWGFPFLHILTKFVICGRLHDGHSDRYEVISHCGFDLHFSDDKQCSVSFHAPLDHLCVFFGKMSFQVFCLFSKRIVWVFDLKLYELFTFFFLLPIIWEARILFTYY